MARPAKRVTGIEFESQEYITHRAFVIGTIFSGIAFLEATINEIFQDASEDINGYIATFSKDNISDMKQYWEKNKLAKTLDKYQEMLKIMSKEPFDKGRAPYQTVSNLIQLRNYLTHYKPESFRFEEDQQLKIFFDGKFHYSKLSVVQDSFFPDKILGAKFSYWMVNKCLVFTNEFLQSNRIG